MELIDLQSSRNAMMRQRTQAASDKEIAQRKAERLKTAYNQVHDVIERARSLESAVQKHESTGDEWKGTKSDKYTKYVSADFKSNYTSYIDQLDDIQDRINSELTKQQNTALRLSGDILGFAQAINSLGHQIQNWFN